MKFMTFLSFSKFVGHFALLDLDPDCESGSGYGCRDPIESGFNPDPDPQHWSISIGTIPYFDSSIRFMIVY
jgi:hypothetical protein